VRTMRQTCTRDVVARPSRPPRRGKVRDAVAAWLPLGFLRGIGPTVDFNPVLWREWHRNRPRRWARIIVGIFVAFALTFSILAILTGPQGLAPWVNALQVAIGLLFVSVVASSSLAEERARGSLDVLLTTRLETAEIVLGKWVATYRVVPLLAILPAFVVMGIAGSDRGLAVAILMAGFVLCAGAAVTSLGLALATWCPRLGRAVGITVSIYLLAAVGWFFGIMAITPGRSPEPLMMGSPFFWAGAMTDSVNRLEADRLWVSAVVWTVLYALAAVALLVATLRTFDNYLGRVSSHSRSTRASFRSAAERGNIGAWTPSIGSSIRTQQSAGR
jgi:ABC-type transport system involved in multi-copper enzyme maturation permease subunit